MMVPIRGLFETHLTVRDLDRSIAFYRDVLQLPLAHVVPERNVAFFWAGAPGQAMLGLWGVGSSPLSLKLHLAFTVDLADVLAAPAALLAAGITPRDFDGREDASAVIVLAWMPAAAVYFQDPDGHSLEFLAMLPDAPRPDLGVLSWTAWQATVSYPQHSTPHTSR